MKRNILSPADAAWLTRTMARRSAQFAGFTMMADDAGEGDSGGDNSEDGDQSSKGGSDSGDKGFPANTPVAEMNADQRAAYWQDRAQKHEGRFKSLVGDRSYDQTKADLDAYAEVKKSEQTPAEQALAAAREEGKAEATTAERNKAATAIFRGALESGGVTGDDLEEIVSNFNVSGYVSDDGIDTSKITNFAKKFSTGPGMGNQNQRHDFGAGRRESAPAVGSVAAVRAAREAARAAKK